MTAQPSDSPVSSAAGGEGVNEPVGSSAGGEGVNNHVSHNLKLSVISTKFFFFQIRHT